jgi:hypothetical protein
MIISLRYFRFWVTLGVTFLFLLPAAFADSEAVEDDTRTYKWFLTVYGGASSQTDFEDVLTFNMDFDDDTYIAVTALARELWRFQNWIGFELEGQIGKYFGQEHQWQFNGLIVGRWLWFPWDKYLDTSFAVGEGLSYNTEISEVELAEDPDATKLLNYLMFELAFGLPQYPRWQLAYRIHHRSSIGGYVGDGASNFVTFGIKFSF